MFQHLNWKLTYFKYIFYVFCFKENNNSEETNLSTEHSDN